MCKKIAFFNRKGGTGKTTSTVNVAGELARRGNKVLVVDSDPQGNASQNLGVYSPERPSLSDVLFGDCSVSDAIVTTGIENIDVLPSNLSLQDAEMRMMISATRKDNFLAKAMKGLEQHDKKYDFIIVDCSPSLSALVVNVLTYVQFVFIPIKTDKNSMEGYGSLVEKVDEVREDGNEKLKIAGVFLTVFEKATAMDNAISTSAKNEFGDMLMSTRIPKNVSLREAPLFNKPVCYYKNNSVGASAYKNLTDEILERIGE